MPFVEKSLASIQARLLAVFLITTLLAVSIVFAFNQWLRVQLLAEADNALLVSAVQIADRIDEFHRSNRKALSVGSRLPDLIYFLKADEETRSDPELRERTRIILDSIEMEPWDEYYVLSQAILDRNGRNILDTAQDNIKADESQQEYFRAALLGGSVTISPIQYRPDLGGIYFYYAVPLREHEAPTTIIGVLRIQFSIANIQNIVFDNVRGSDLNIAVFDENYVRIADNQHEELLFRSIAGFSPEEITALKSQYALPPLRDEDVSFPMPGLADALSNTHREKIVSGYTIPDSDGEERLAIIKLETVPWYLVMSQPASQYYQTVQRQTAGILILAISLTFVALLASYLISERITKPIRALTAVAEQVAEGQLHIKAPITSRDEVGTLAKTFNMMTTELELAHATLEERVQQRTQELSNANERLTYEIAERKRYEKQALELALEQERRRILSEFILKASHEFKTPLSIINMNSYMVKRLLPDEKYRYIDTIEKQVNYIDGLVSRMVLLSRLDGEAPTPLQYVPVDTFMRQVYAREEESFQEKNASVDLDLQAKDVWIFADSDLMFVAVQNILENALKNSKDPVEISIKTRTHNETVSIVIADNGIGIPEDLQTHVFESFFRADKAHSTRGFGLGLPLAKRIIETVGGIIELESKVGKGTTVTITLSTKEKPHV
ncbi:MAG: sensor histidine kinase [Anaerolineaceae bacterium]|nr:sensor histidine kinase [Anaerolineaceae bacterium]